MLESEEGFLGESRPLSELLLVLSAAMDIIRFSSGIRKICILSANGELTDVYNLT